MKYDSKEDLLVLMAVQELGEASVAEIMSTLRGM